LSKTAQEQLAQGLLKLMRDADSVEACCNSATGAFWMQKKYPHSVQHRL